jgi:hypothetical protein
MTTDGQTLQKLTELRTAIAGYPDPRRAADEWKQVYKLLVSAQVPAGRVGGVVGMRSLAGLDELLASLENPQAAAQAAPDAPDDDTCRRAYAAFKKRLSLTVLDEESKLGRSPLTKGAATSAAAIEPPVEWPRSVWDELVRRGKLRYIGHGFYSLHTETLRG